jgi:AcrR family transcriptional regulator
LSSAAATSPNKRGSTRTRMLISAAEVLRERGAAGVTIDEVLARSGAPRGSVYHHFPAGRNQILTEALRLAGEEITEVIDAAAAKGGIYLVRQFVAFWEELLAESDFTAGCPVLAAAIGSADDEPQLTSLQAASSATGATRSPVHSSPTASTSPTPPHWRSRASRRWRARWCCAGPPARWSHCATSRLSSNSSSSQGNSSVASEFRTVARPVSQLIAGLWITFRTSQWFELMFDV